MSFSSIDSALHALAGHSTAVDALATTASQAGIEVAGVAAVVLLWPRREVLRGALAAIAGALIALGVGALVGAAWDRPRPFVAGNYAPLVAHTADGSFPSDHLIAIGALMAAAWLVWRPAAAAIGAVGAAVAIGRAVSGIHYMTDLAAGCVLGIVATWVCWQALGPAAGALRTIESVGDRLPFRMSEPPRGGGGAPKDEARAAVSGPESEPIDAR